MGTFNSDRNINSIDIKYVIECIFVYDRNGEVAAYLLSTIGNVRDIKAYNVDDVHRLAYNGQIQGYKYDFKNGLVRLSNLNVKEAKFSFEQYVNNRVLVRV